MTLKRYLRSVYKMKVFGRKIQQSNSQLGLKIFLHRVDGEDRSQ